MINGSLLKQLTKRIQTHKKIFNMMISLLEFSRLSFLSPAIVAHLFSRLTEPLVHYMVISQSKYSEYTTNQVTSQYSL